MTTPDRCAHRRNQHRVEIHYDVHHIDRITTRFAQVSVDRSTLTAERCPTCHTLIERYRYKPSNLPEEVILASDRDRVIDALTSINSTPGRLDLIESRLGEQYRPDTVTHLLTDRPRITIRETP